MKKYGASYWLDTIVEVWVIKETKDGVWFPDGTSVTKKGRDGEYFDTWEEAHDYLLKRQQERVDSLHRQLEEAKARLENIEGMKRPE